MTKSRSNSSAPAAKGQLVVGTGTDASGILSVSSNGETLVVDSSTSTGLSYMGNYASGKNSILNGALQVWQRGTSFADAGTVVYTADRWAFFRALTGTATVSRQTASLDGFQYSIRAQRNSGNTGTSIIYLTQNLETVSTLPLVGKKVTLSFYAKAGANYSSASNALGVFIKTGTGTDQNWINSYTGIANAANTDVTLTTSWQRFTLTTAAVLASSVNELAVSFQYTPSGTAGANDWFEITGVQLETGTVASAFQTATGTLAGELQACQRYYEKSYNLSVTPGTSYTAGLDGIQIGGPTSNIDFAFYWKVTKRAEPTMTIYDAAGSTGVVSAYTGSWLNGQAIAGSRTKENYGSLDTNITNSSIISFQYVASAEL